MSNSVHSISQEQAVEMTASYRENLNTILAEAYRESNILPYSETFEVSEVMDMLKVEGTAKMRIYYGMDTELKVHAILVAVNEKDEDILTDNVESALLLENSLRCPTLCPPSSVLNS